MGKKKNPESGKGLGFFALLSSWKTKPLHDPPRSHTPPESGGGLAKNWEPVFVSFFFFFFFYLAFFFFVVVVSYSHPGALSQIPSPWLHRRPWAEAAETLPRLFTRDFAAAADLRAAPPKQTRPRQARLNFCLFYCFGVVFFSYPLTALTFFRCYLCIFFSTAKKKYTKKRKNTKGKKIIKRLEKNTTQKQFCLALHIVYRTSTHNSGNRHTHTHARAHDSHCSYFAHGSFWDKTNKI